MLEILERIVNDEGEMEDLDRLEELAKMIQSMALCGLGKSAPLPVLSTLKTFRDEYEDISVTTSVVQKSVRQCADSLSTQSSVRAVESVQRTVRWELSQVCVRRATTLIRACASSVRHVRITVHLTLSILKHRGDEYGNNYNRWKKKIVGTVEK